MVDEANLPFKPTPHFSRNEIYYFLLLLFYLKYTCMPSNIK